MIIIRILLVSNIFIYLFMTPVKQESAVLANDEPHFKCVQFHLPVFAMFVSRINFDFCNRVGVNCRSLNEKLFGWITIKIDFLVKLTSWTVTLNFTLV